MSEPQTIVSLVTNAVAAAFHSGFEAGSGNWEGTPPKRIIEELIAALQAGNKAEAPLRSTGGVAAGTVTNEPEPEPFPRTRDRRWR